MQPRRPWRFATSSRSLPASPAGRFAASLRPSVFIHLRTIASVSPFPARVYQNTRVWGCSRRHFVTSFHERTHRRATTRPRPAPLENAFSWPIIYLSSVALSFVGKEPS